MFSGQYIFDVSKPDPSKPLKRNPIIDGLMSDIEIPDSIRILMQLGKWPQEIREELDKDICEPCFTYPSCETPPCYCISVRGQKYLQGWERRWIGIQIKNLRRMGIFA